MQIPENIKIEVSKAIEQLALAAKSYGLDQWAASREKAEWKYDFGIMRAYNDLTAVCLELLASDDTILVEFKIRFNSHSTRGRFSDPAGGVELPLIGQPSDCLTPRMQSRIRAPAQRHVE